MFMFSPAIEVEGRVFTYVRQNNRWPMRAEYEIVFVPKNRKREIKARLEADNNGRVITIVTFVGYDEKRINYRVKTPGGIEFLFGGTFAGFTHLFGIGREDIKRSSRIRKPLPNGWQFWRLSYAVFIP